MKIGILTYGCPANKSDSEIMAGLLTERGFDPILGSEDPDTVIVNTCIVKGPTEDRILRKLDDLRASGKRVIVAGCMPEAYPELLRRYPEFIAIGTNPYEIVGAVAGEGPNQVRKSYFSKAVSKKVRINNLIGIHQISEGCLGNCAYCATRLARGALVSYPPEEILKAVEFSIRNGCREIWITSQDNGCYGFDIGTDLAELLQEIVAIPGDFRVRVGMMNPLHTRNIADRLVEVYTNPKIYKFLHIPVQSGSDKVLRDMNRGYTVKDFEGIISKFRDRMEITISTDVIVGFPTEEDTDFERTMDLINRTRPDFLNISKFWPRRGTPAASMQQLPRDVISERTRALAELYSSILRKKNQKWLGRACRVLVTEKRGKYLIGRNDLYRPVLLMGEYKLGHTYNVRISATRKTEIVGEALPRKRGAAPVTQTIESNPGASVQSEPK